MIRHAMMVGHIYQELGGKNMSSIVKIWEKLALVVMIIRRVELLDWEGEWINVKGVEVRIVRIIYTG